MERSSTIPLAQKLTRAIPPQVSKILSNHPAYASPRKIHIRKSQPKTGILTRCVEAVSSIGSNTKFQGYVPTATCSPKTTWYLYSMSLVIPIQFYGRAIESRNVWLRLFVSKKCLAAWVLIDTRARAEQPISKRCPQRRKTGKLLAACGIASR